jgi:hemerythrin
VIRNILDDLIIYTGTHFNVEEKYFAQFAYPDAQARTKQHLTCIDMAEKISMKFHKEFARGKICLNRGTYALHK